ncbi:hypothetical protein A2856_02230 [Candidatus Uhrbacteria bacterium RIFCSPHIGHO2_01_FULL_63_20]|uniref:M23ase beta-sheet core domain-containing protein n=1 Tax=Candidatus Uhrbacteria bacterium RIFCSPHIGHO2_01_FULL_63_20 TaxID=1802385 RepID=A0A1F7TLS2_9BACT|nr:MAG: hypothetical protein A2856_02230 [Candidatus Uhrbacteria bacterium RIFCSPHIGHO2_01_FULL_63_20]
MQVSTFMVSVIGSAMVLGGLYNYAGCTFLDGAAGHVRDFADQASSGSRTETYLVTAYSSERRQTDDTPCFAEPSKTEVCRAFHEQNKLVCASNDFDIGITLDVPGYGTCTVLDRMAERGKIDVYFGGCDVAVDKSDACKERSDVARRKALEWGSQTLLVTIRSIVFEACPTVVPKITSGYGWRKKPRHRFHDGWDMKAARGSPVYAAHDGKVVVKRLDADGCGKYLDIEFASDPDLKTRYCHLDRYHGGLEVGSMVKAGELIGLAGSTGNAKEDEPHLHFEVKLEGQDRNPDPARYLHRRCWSQEADVRIARN